MYTKPIIYKIYSVIIFAVSVIGFISSMIFAFSSAGILNAILPGEFRSGTALYIVCTVIASLLSLFFAYVEFTSMFTFAQMIEHEESGSDAPFRRMGIVFSPKFYKNFGNIMFYIPLLVSFIAVVALVISYSVSHKAFVAIPLIPIAIILLSLFLTYVTYYCRYRTFSDLLELKSNKEVGIKTLDSLSESKPNALRGYCIFLFALAIICFIGSIVSMFIVGGTLSAIVGSGWIVVIEVGIFINAIVTFMVFGVIGCYYDNLAKMLEHYMVKFKLL